MLGTVYVLPGTEDADQIKGECATFLRYATVLHSQTKSMTAQKIGLLNGKMMRVAVFQKNPKRHEIARGASIVVIYLYPSLY